MIDRNKLYWMRKLSKSKNYVVLTDKESVVNITGIDPESFKDTMLVSAQIASLKEFSNNIVSLIKDYENALTKRVSKPRKKAVKKPIKK